MNKVLLIYNPRNAIADFDSLFKQNTIDKVRLGNKIHVIPIRE